MGIMFTINASGSLVELNPAPYEKEKILESLIAEYPRVLGCDAGSGDGDRRWMLIKQQFRIPRTQLPIDLLLVDQDGIPTIVEVKRASNSEIRRDVVGQIVQYGASIVANVDVEALKTEFRRRCESGDKSSEKELEDFLLGSQTADEFWGKVKNNLATGRICMVVVADEIPEELRGSLDFLNEQMAPTEVFAIAIPQCIDKSQSMRILAPQKIISRILGQGNSTQEGITESSPVHRPAEWTTAVQFNRDESIRKFFLREAQSQKSSVSVRKIYYNADGIVRWRLQLNQTTVNMYQQMRFEGDLTFWKNIFPGIDIRTPDQGRQLSYNLTSAEQLEKFVETVRSADGKFMFLLRGVPGDSGTL